MTRKHFEAIARILKSNRDDSQVQGGTTEELERVEVIADDFASFCAAQNPNFDRDRFLTACGVE